MKLGTSWRVLAAVLVVGIVATLLVLRHTRSGLQDDTAYNQRRSECVQRWGANQQQFISVHGRAPDPIENDQLIDAAGEDCGRVLSGRYAP